MATVRSLGFHQPTAIPYLVAESILPADPSEGQYSWKSYSFDDGKGQSIEEEIVFTDSCVVWCRGGVVKRSFRFGVEKESVVQALFAYFKTSGQGKQNAKKSSGQLSINSSSRRRAATPDVELKTRVKSKKRQQVTIQDKATNDDANGIPYPENNNDSGLSRALIVVLKSQAHIFFLSGDSHIIPLPFEVDSVWPTPHGLLFQRKVDEAPSRHVPPVPPNSFVSSQTPRPGGRTSGSFKLSTGSGPRPSLTISPAQTTKPAVEREKDASLPRVFTLMDPHSEMGLVTSKYPNDSRMRNWDALDPDEEIIYVSSADETPKGMVSDPESPPLIFVVTLNESLGTYTIWTARYIDKDVTLSKSKRRASSMTGINSKRRSSYFDPTTGVTTPVGRGPAGLRESFSIANPGRNASNMSQPLNNAQPSQESNGSEDLESQLGQEFGDISVPLKASRRVSSLLARADLAANNDRATFSELATGNPTAPSVHGGTRRGESFGGSIRGSFGFRNSLPPGNTSIYSNGSSFLDAPVDKFLQSLNNGGDFEGFDTMGLRETASGLPREMVLAKVESFSSGFSTTRGIPTSAKRRKFEVFTVTSFQGISSDETQSAQVALCILNRNSKNLIVTNLSLDISGSTASTKSYGQKYGKKSRSADQGIKVRASEVCHMANVVDCCKLVDGDVSRILVLSNTIDGRGELTLQAPWSTVFKVELPPTMLVHDPFSLSLSGSSSLPREGSLKRILNNTSLNMHGLAHPTNRGKVDVVDSRGRRHRIQIQLEPRNPLVKQVLAVCRFVMQRLERAGDGILVSWCEALKWLHARNETAGDLEWTALVVTLFTMAVYFIESEPEKKRTPQKRKRSEFLRSSSGSSIDLGSWEAMLEQESGPSGVTSSWMMNAAWGWISEENQKSTEEIHKNDASHKEGYNEGTKLGLYKNDYITRCAHLARDFLQSPQGEAASGSEGYLPTAISRDHETRRTALGTILVGLHLLREERKLSIIDAETSHSDIGLLGPVLAQIGVWLGWSSWSCDGYYGVETANMERWLFEKSRITSLDIPDEPFPPPSIFSFIENTLHNISSRFLTMVDIVASSRSSQDNIWEQALRLTPRTLALVGSISGNKQRTPKSQVESLGRWGLTNSLIDSFPDGISTPFQEAIVCCQASPPVSWGPRLLELVDRNDIYLSIASNNTSISKAPVQQSHDAIRDVNQIVYSALDSNSINSFEATAEADRQSVTRLIFSEDRRFYEAAKILNQMRAPVAECSAEPEWSDADLLEAQKEVVQIVSLRTLSIPTGRAMMSFSGRVPLLTEKLPIPSFSLQCIMKPSNVTVSADRSSFTEEKVCWAFFHNGASTGLAISKAAKGIDTSWILYNRPLELTNRHAGFLLALGLNGHLKSLAKWVAFKYLTPKHTMTSIGLLLGLSASYIGTMDTLVTRLLSVHVTRMLPPGAAELNLSPLTQTTGLMGIGLLYCDSQHRRMSEIMLSEIENVEQEDSSISQEVLRDEGYRLAAGFALGLINLGKGKDLRGLRDMHVVDRLLTLAVGTKNVDIVHVLDRATAGATVALAIMFLKSNDASVAEKIDIPDTLVQFDYVRPDIFLLRSLAKQLIMWDSIKPSYEWIKKSLPRPYKRKYRLKSSHSLTTDDMPFFNIIAGLCFAIGLRFAGSASLEARDLLVSYLDQFMRICKIPAVNYDGRLTRNSARNCEDVVALSAAAVMAGTGDILVFRRLRSLHGRVDADIPYGSHMASHMAIGMLFLGGGTYTLGTSDLGIAALLCSFYPIFPTTVLDNKCHLQAFRHLWVLAAEPRCLIPRDLETRRAVTVPINLISKKGDQKVVTAPCLLPDLFNISTIKIENGDFWNLTLDFLGNENLREKFRSGDQSVYLRRRAPYNTSDSSVFSASLMALKDTQDMTPFFSKPEKPSANNTFTKALSSKRKSPARVRAPSLNVWDWVFNLEAFQRLDMGEKGLVVPWVPFQQPLAILNDDHDGNGSSNNNQKTRRTLGSLSWLRPTAVDTRLALEKTVQDWIAAANGQAFGEDTTRDRLWQLKLLIEWMDATQSSNTQSKNGGEGSDKLNSSGLWLKNEVIERARWRIWGIQVGDNGASE